MIRNGLQWSLWDYCGIGPCFDSISSMKTSSDHTCMPCKYAPNYTTGPFLLYHYVIINLFGTFSKLAYRPLVSNIQHYTPLLSVSIVGKLWDWFCCLIGRGRIASVFIVSAISIKTQIKYQVGPGGLHHALVQALFG
jgi:hypothetical protein